MRKTRSYPVAAMVNSSLSEGILGSNLITLGSFAPMNVPLTRNEKREKGDSNRQRSVSIELSDVGRPLQRKSKKDQCCAYCELEVRAGCGPSCQTQLRSSKFNTCGYLRNHVLPR